MCTPLKPSDGMQLKADSGIRTHDPSFTKAVLYQLSYVGNGFEAVWLDC